MEGGCSSYLANIMSGGSKITVGGGGIKEENVVQLGFPVSKLNGNKNKRIENLQIPVGLVKVVKPKKPENNNWNTVMHQEPSDDVILDELFGSVRNTKQINNDKKV
jgi:hypothetical protein